MASGSFDETDFESLYFQGINFDDARNILIEEEEGTFLIRNSSRGGYYVICVKEKDDVSQYTVNVRDVGGQTNFFIREEYPFKSLSALLTFYKRNMFHTTSLKRPVSSERVILRRSGKEGSDRGFVRSEIPNGPHPGHLPLHPSSMRRSAPPDMSKPYDSPSQSTQGSHPPLFARVLKAREPSPYTKDLTLKVNDIIKVTSRNHKEGKGTGELNGTVGDFPLVCVEFLNNNLN